MTEPATGPRDTISVRATSSLPQQPARRSTDHERVVRRGASPQERLVDALFPVWKHHAARVRISDDHGQAAGNLLTLIASARLHKLDPEVYLRDVFRVLPHWPRGRYLELAPRYWRITRARINRAELDREIGWRTVPELPLPTMLPSDVLVASLSPAP